MSCLLLMISKSVRTKFNPSKVQLSSASFQVSSAHQTFILFLSPWLRKIGDGDECSLGSGQEGRERKEFHYSQLRGPEQFVRLRLTLESPKSGLGKRRPKSQSQSMFPGASWLTKSSMWIILHSHRLFLSLGEASPVRKQMNSQAGKKSGDHEVVQNSLVLWITWGEAGASHGGAPENINWTSIAPDFNHKRYLSKITSIDLAIIPSSNKNISISEKSIISKMKLTAPAIVLSGLCAAKVRVIADILSLPKSMYTLTSLGLGLCSPGSHWRSQGSHWRLRSHNPGMGSWGVPRRT